MQLACDFKRLSLEDGTTKDSKIIEYHESKDDSPISRGQIADQHPKEMQSTGKLLFCCYCRTISLLSSNFSAASIGESESFSSSCSEEGVTLIAIKDLDIGQWVHL